MRSDEAFVQSVCVYILKSKDLAADQVRFTILEVSKSYFVVFFWFCWRVGDLNYGQDSSSNLQQVFVGQTENGSVYVVTASESVCRLQVDERVMARSHCAQRDV